MNIKIIMLFFFVCFSTAELQAKNQSDKQEIALILQNARDLIQENRHQQAADILERFLMTGSAAEDVIEMYQKVLKVMDQKIQAYNPQIQLNQQWQTQGKLGVSLGGGDNLNRAPSDKNINLTQGGGAVTLSKEQQRQAGYGVETRASLWGGKQLTAASKLNVALQILNRTTDQKNFTDYLQINSSINLQHKLTHQDEIGVALFTDVLQYDNETRFYSIDLLGRYAWQLNQSCFSQTGIDLQWKHQKDNHLFDSFYTGVAATVRCLWGGGHYNIGVNAGNEWALDEQRPGGSQWRVRIQLSHERETDWLREKDQLSHYLNLDSLYDQEGYSILLENNQKRVMQRLAIGAKYRIPIVRGNNPWWGVIRTEWQKQYSPIELFEFQSFELWTGIEVQW